MYNYYINQEDIFQAEKRLQPFVLNLKEVKLIFEIL